jgi:RimJ/RimL family protein N-acetyltransferase
MDVFLTTDRLVLRRFSTGDVDNLVALDADPEVMRFLNGGIPTSRDDIATGILPRFLAYYERFQAFGYWAAEEKTSGRFAGWFCLKPPEGGNGREVELGYRLRRPVWGRGYATEVVHALLSLAFTSLAVERVFATTYEYNAASRRVMEKAGMRLVRTFRLSAAQLAASATFDGTSLEVWEGDEVEYAIERPEWEAR